MDGKRKAEDDPVLTDILISVLKNFTKYVTKVVKKLNMRGYGWNKAGEMKKNDSPFFTLASWIFSYTFSEMLKHSRNFGRFRYI